MEFFIVMTGDFHENTVTLDRLNYFYYAMDNLARANYKGGGDNKGTRTILLSLSSRMKADKF
jgi:hypothetical protein